jgi:mono/diheme cytochrome c family protein
MLNRSLLFLACFVSTSQIFAQVPKTWDEKALADWATPVAGLNVRPSHISSAQYYAIPEYNLRTYPVYLPDREPAGYWEMLQSIGPKPLIEPKLLKTSADWIAAGKRVFDEATTPQLTVADPKLIEKIRDPEFLRSVRATAFPDGTLGTLRWVPTPKGLAVANTICGGCHLLTRPDGTKIPGPSARAEASRARPFRAVGVGPEILESENRVLRGASPFFMNPGGFGDWLYQAYGVPWLESDPNLRLKDISPADYQALVAEERMGGIVTRWNGSPLFPAKIPDLIGVQERKYIDHTATHRHRDIGDFMRYAALVTFADSADFGPHRMVHPDTKRVNSRLPDAALYALAKYIYSLQPPPNPNPFNSEAESGAKIFAREGCPGCHTPPLYTNNKLTLAKGFSPPASSPVASDVLLISVGTDPGLALQTRKGTGYYKVPSLKGVWYRGHYLHDGSVASLEEMFDPDRTSDSHVPGGWKPASSKTYAIQGHVFGLKLTPQERAQLIAFLRTF